ncbi:hypothetical protein ABE137_12225 [Brevibacillus laterosporus]|uniref:hypothetical protein n=1 Tax=Brevibacillus phage Sundance TaxID=1691958 RepID=UPI0006BD55F0|nr:hypothetical protein AVT09_gp117 [Brevibacillus phage Sundance]ALA47933.1 hypothetical protein SUNDANCE_117 [Brevibacillus phage Sundance]
MKRVYANQEYYTSTDENLLIHYEKIGELKGMNEDLYRKGYKALCKSVRKSIGITNAIGLCKFTEDEIVIFVYDVEATEDNFYKQCFDSESKQLYIEIEEEKS